MSEGLFVETEIKRPSKKVLDDFLKIGELSSTVSDVLDSMGLKGAIGGFQSICEGTVIAGPAITIKQVVERFSVTTGYVSEKPIGTTQIIYPVTKPGDVVVIEEGHPDIAHLGELAVTTARLHGIQGHVIDGGIRDVKTIRAMKYPVFCRGFSPIGSKYRLATVSVCGIINIGCVQVKPGDIVLADDTGIAIVPLELAEGVLNRAREYNEDENQFRKKILGKKWEKASDLWTQEHARIAHTRARAKKRREMTKTE